MGKAFWTPTNSSANNSKNYEVGEHKFEKPILRKGASTRKKGQPKDWVKLFDNICVIDSEFVEYMKKKKITQPINTFGEKHEQSFSK